MKNIGKHKSFPIKWRWNKIIVSEKINGKDKPLAAYIIASSGNLMS